ncbi:MAG: HNH endonuclease [Candidatus Thiodiazotropha lotti]|nr:HNH endonuclease [Candidatus Thiodiazotropha lotti]
MDTTDQRFTLIATNGDKLYPYKKTQRGTNKHGFVLSKPGEGDRYGQGIYTDSIEEVIKRLVFDGWNVRAKTAGTVTGQREGTFGIDKRAIRGFEVASEFNELIRSAPRQPMTPQKTGMPSNSGESEDPLSKNETYAETPIDEVTFQAIKTRRGQSGFRDALLLAYGGRCCISGCDVTSVLEAAHIVPHTTETNYAVTNGLLLRADIHTLFDLNLIGVDETGTVSVAESLKGTEYEQYQDHQVAGQLHASMAENLKRRSELFQRP